MFRRARVVPATVCIVLCFTVAVLAQDSATVERVVPEIKALRINPEPPVIDGQLNDEVWQDADLILARDFTQRDPDEGKAATESTLVAVRYDDDAVYFAFWCYDSEPDKVVGQLVRRDRWSEADMVSVRLDPYHDHQTGYAFDLSVSGVQRDHRVYNDDNTDISWDGVWEADARRQPWGWSAEMRIPYHCLRFTEKPEHVWGVDFLRIINRKTEWARWAFTPSSEGGFASKFGHLTGLSGIVPARHIEVLPYAVSKTELTDKTAGNPDGRDVFGNTGLDLKYGISSNLTLDATFNPDFGQVELDEPVLNLSAFETFFDERRPFFMEGADLYESEYTLFYSRRIGRAPTMGVNDTLYDYSIYRPTATTILGAAKLTGKLPGGTSFAYLNAMTQEEKEEYATITGETREAIIEPLADYSVFRVKQDVFDRSNIGGMLTLAGQDTRHPSLTGGLDWRMVTNNGNWGFSGQTVFSRNDAEHVGFGIDAILERLSGEHVRGAVGINIEDPYLNNNRLGYNSRSDIRQAWSWVHYRTQNDWWIIRNTYNNLNLSSSWNYAGDDIGRGGNFNTYIEFTNNWSMSASAAMQAEKYSDVETRGNGLWEWPEYPTFAYHLTVSSDTRKQVNVDVSENGGRDRGGTWWNTYLGARFRPRSNLEFSGGTSYFRSFGGTRWVYNDGDQSIFADLDQDQIFAQLTASVMLTRNLSWQISGEGLISSLDYANYRRYMGGQNYDPNITARDYDGTYSALNTMVIVRWEYLPGSTLYFVWTRSRPEWDSSVNQMHLADEFDRFFSRGATNVWLVKASYWWNI